MTLFQKLLHDEHGFIITTELVIVATLLVIGLITGIQCLQTAVVNELKDVGAAIGSLNQSYSYSGMHGCWSWGRSGAHYNYTRGSVFVDEVDEYRYNYEIGCVDLQPGTVIERRSIEVAPSEIIESVPAQDGVCPPETMTSPEGPTLAPQPCPPDQACPPESNCPDANCDS